jgi:hypothetical protein
VGSETGEQEEGAARAEAEGAQQTRAERDRLWSAVLLYATGFLRYSTMAI